MVKLLIASDSIIVYLRFINNALSVILVLVANKIIYVYSHCIIYK